MAADRTLAALRAADPARALAPVTAAERERLLAAILAAPPGRTDAPAPRRRTRVALAAALTVAALVLGGWTARELVLVTGPDPVRDEFAAATAELPLPPGARWEEPALAGEGELYGRYSGLLAAVDQATCAWFGEWGAADGAGDARGVRAAADAVARIRAAIPIHAPGAPEEAGGFTPGSLRAFDAIVADARAGDTSGIARYVRANCPR